MKQAFQSLGTALDSGNLSDAKAALAQLEKNAPPGAAKAGNPLSAKIEALSKAIDSGDLKAAKEAFADIKKTIAQGPPKGAGRHGRPSGPPPGGSSDTAGTTKTYDAKDTDQDGKVSKQEEQAYEAKHALDALKSSTGENSQVSGRSLEAWA
ncbi:MAG: hypothetical protein K8R23_15730 [Chthoniobacter sp.]|nr:hypothetical protein [Chthoniobacter sp.]